MNRRVREVLLHLGTHEQHTDPRAAARKSTLSR
jgi:hypothetical protein